MSAIIIQDFRAGLDARHMPETTLPGAVLTADNCVINEGGEIEKQKAWVSRHVLPSGTFGLETFGEIINVYGSISDPGVPQKVTYNQLVAATGQAMIAVESGALFEGKQYMSIRTFDGSIVHFYDGAEVTALKDDRAFASFILTGGAEGSVNSIKADSVEILSGPVPFNTSLDQTAADVVQSINDNISTPNYTAIQNGTRIIVKHEAGGTAANGFVFAPEVFTMTTTVDTGVFEGGVTNASNIFRPGPYVRTIKSKMYFLVGSLLHFSNIGLPLEWDPLVGVGAGFIDLSNHSAGTNQLQAIAEYLDRYAIFGTTSTQIWSLDPDENLNKLQQNIRFNGAFSAGSVQAFGNDTVFLDRSGVRSLRARDSSQSANVTDIGTAIDPLIRNLILTKKTAAQKSVSVIDPLTGRYYLAIDDTIFTFSLFPGNKISAWTTSKPGIVFSELEEFELSIIGRSGDTIHQLGGTDGLQYDSTVANIRLPFVDAGDASRLKKMFGVDFAMVGTWRVFLAQDATDLTLEREVGVFTKSTFKLGNLPVNGKSSHFSLRFESVDSAFAKIGRVVIHFKPGRQE